MIFFLHDGSVADKRIFTTWRYIIQLYYFRKFWYYFLLQAIDIVWYHYESDKYCKLFWSKFKKRDLSDNSNQEEDARNWKKEALILIDSAMLQKKCLPTV